MNSKYTSKIKIFTNDIIPPECIMNVKTFKEVANFCGYRF